MDADLNSTNSPTDWPTTTVSTSDDFIEYTPDEKSPCTCRHELIFRGGRLRSRRTYRCDYCYAEIGEYLAYLRTFWERVDRIWEHAQRLEKRDSNQDKVVLKCPMLQPARVFGDRLPANPEQDWEPGGLLT